MNLSGLERRSERVPRGTGVQGPGSLDMRGWPASATIRSAFIFGVIQGHILAGKTVSEWINSVSECAESETFLINASVRKNGQRSAKIYRALI